MYSQSDIEDAVAGGALTAEQAASLRNHVAARNGTPTADEEPVRWLGGNSDVYVFYSSILLLVGLGWLGSKIEVGNPPSFMMALLVAAGAWGLAEYFSRRKRLPLSGIAYAVVFGYAVYFTVMLLAVSAMGQSSSMDSMNTINAISALVGAGGAFLFWKRFNEPIAVSVGVTLVVMAIMFLLGSTMSPMERSGEVAEIVLLVLGLGIFAFAMWWDSKDPRRVTRSNDTGFWLHMNASWTVVMALCMLLNLFEGPASVLMSVVTILLFVLLTLVALAVDRRTWVLAAALPLGVGLYWLINGQPRRFEDMDSYGSGYDSMGGGAYGGGGYGGSSGNSQDSMMITLLILGILLVVIGMFWSQIRGTVVGMLPAGLRARVPGTDLQPVGEAQTFN